MLLMDLIAGGMVVTGAALMLIGGIGLALTRIEELEGGPETDETGGENHEHHIYD